MTKKHIAIWIAAGAALAIGFLAPVDLRGEFYRYVDENGTVHYVDDLSKVPDDQHPSLKTYQEKYDHLDPEERDRRLLEDRRQEELREAAERQRLEQERAAAERAGESSVSIAGNQVLVPARLSYQGREADITFLLDTGASITTLHKGAVQSLRIHGGTPSKTQVVGGRIIPSQIVQFDYIQVGPLKVENAVASVLEHRGRAVRYDGLLGMNILKHADYTIDFDREVIIWRPKSGREAMR